MRPPITILQLSFIATLSTAFVPNLPLQQRPQLSRLFYQNGEDAEAPKPILPRVEESQAFQPPIPAPPQEQQQQQQERKLIIPFQRSIRKRKQSILDTIAAKYKSIQKRPGAKFRLKLGLVATAALAVLSGFRAHTQAWNVTRNWIAHRGWQGFAALGRSVAYLWAVLIAYPRMLDKRARESKRQRQDEEVNRRREQLRQLAGEVARLRQELANVEAEIRAFRREIISLKAYAKDDDPEVQEAIGAEMAHLTQLRSDTQAALAAARQSWAEFRSKSPPDIWDDALVP